MTTTCVKQHYLYKQCRHNTVLYVFSETDGINVHRHLTDAEQRKPSEDTWQQFVDDRGAHVDDALRPDDDDVLARRVMQASSSRSGDISQHEAKTKRNHVERRYYGADSFGSQYNVLDQIGSNIIRRKSN